MDHALRNIVDHLQTLSSQDRRVPHRHRTLPRHLIILVRKLLQAPGDKGLLEHRHLNGRQPLPPHSLRRPDHVLSKHVPELLKTMNVRLSTSYYLRSRPSDKVTSRNGNYEPRVFPDNP